MFFYPLDRFHFTQFVLVWSSIGPLRDVDLLNKTTMLWLDTHWFFLWAWNLSFEILNLKFRFIHSLNHFTICICLSSFQQNSFGYFLLLKIWLFFIFFPFSPLSYKLHSRSPLPKKLHPWSPADNEHVNYLLQGRQQKA